jgi:glycerol-3-phosphate dehydrogenase
MDVETLIFGGGAAGLWLLDELVRRCRSAVLLESRSLGAGQTVASQGIIHGGLKYSLSGLLTKSAAAIREMPGVWRECLAGRCEPRLTGTRLRAEFCHLWQTASVSSRLGMLGARFGLHVAPRTLARDERPDVLCHCPGTVARLEEQVIAPETFLADLAARHGSRLLRIGRAGFDLAGPGRIRAVEVSNPETQESLTLVPRWIVFAAGSGNAELSRLAGLAPGSMQRRPLHMVLARGDLPALNGHCVDGARTRVTITSDRDPSGRTVWQIGGQVAEDGVMMDERALVAHTRGELCTVIPGLDLAHAEWATYRVDRAERAMAGSARPDAPQVLHEGNVLTVWPTKLAFAPQLARELVAVIERESTATISAPALPDDWPRPSVAQLPWETVTEWLRLDSSAPAGTADRAAA